MIFLVIFLLGLLGQEFGLYHVQWYVLCFPLIAMVLWPSLIFLQLSMLSALWPGAANQILLSYKRVRLNFDNPLRIYIAGPYTLGSPLINTHDAIRVATRLMDNGYVPFVPHLSHFWNELYERPYECWLRQDRIWLGQCDVLLRLPGLSDGADMEVELAQSLGIPVYYDVNELLNQKKKHGGKNQPLKIEVVCNR